MIKELLLKAQEQEEPISVTYGIYGEQVDITYNPMYIPTCAIIVRSGMEEWKFSMEEIDGAIETFKAHCGWV